MALKRTSRTRKRELEQPDRFETALNKTIQFILKNKLQASIGLGIIVALCIIVAGMQYFAYRSENKAFALLGQGMNQYRSVIQQTGPEKAYRDVAKDFQQIIQKYPGNNGSKLAMFVFGNICYRAGSYDQAIELYQQSLINFEGFPFFKNLALSGLAYSYEAKKDYDTAAKFFETIVSTPDAGFKDEALFNLAEIYAHLGNRDQRSNAFKKIISDYPDSIYLEIAKEKGAG
jgi:TolA-binding protein